MSSMVETRRGCQAVPDAECGVVVGVDISKGHFDWRPCRLSKWGKGGQHPRSEAGFLAFERQLQRLEAEGLEVWVAMEPTGPYGTCLQEWLLERGWRVVLVNPYHVHRTKEVSDNSPRKDDRTDPRVIADLVWRGSYCRVRRRAGPYAELRAGTDEWHSLAKKRTAVRNEAQALLEGWFPELTEVFTDPLCQSARAVIRRYVSPQAMRAKGKRSLQAALRRGTQGQGGRYTESLWEAAQHTVALGEGQERRGEALRELVRQVEGIEGRQEQVAAALAQALAQTEEGEYVRSIPGVGVVLAGGLLGECGPLADFPNARAFEKFAGLQLYRESSGTWRGRVRVSKRGRSGVRRVLGQLAAWHMRAGGLGEAWAQRRKAQGQLPGKVQVALARKLGGVVYTLGKNRRYFDRDLWDAKAQTADGVRPLQGTPVKA